MYKAFISYSHRDSQWATWLHRQLERYRLPRHIAQSLGQPAKIGKIFRDRDELSSGHNLTDHIQNALKDSENLIVVCSPDAVNSQWVNAEIEYFQSLGKRERIFCLLVDGGDDAFPAALTNDEHGNAVIPLAADPREWADGKDLAKLKIVAGMLGVRLDELVQRDRQRKRQQLLLAAASGIAVLSISLFAYVSSIEKQHQQQQAEKLASFVLDLGARLENRIDVKSQIAINTEGLNYLQQFDPETLSTEARARIAEAYRQLGIARQAQQLISIDEFLYSHSIYQELARQDPTTYLFEEGQAAFYIGSDFFYRGELKEAAKYFKTYSDISLQLFNSNKSNSLYQAELLNAQATMLALELENDPTSKTALDTSRNIQLLIEEIEHHSQSIDTFLALANANEWLGELYEQQSDQESHFGAIYKSLEFYTRALEIDPSNLEVTEKILNSEFKLGLIIEDTAVRREYLEKALNRTKSLRAIDEANEYWREYEEKLIDELAKF